MFNSYVSLLNHQETQGETRLLPHWPMLKTHDSPPLATKKTTRLATINHYIHHY
jgi:hypothetical protein